MLLKALWKGEIGMQKTLFRRDQIRKEIEQLEGPVLTFYLNTNPLSEEWKIRLKNGLKRIVEYHKASNPEEAKLISDISEKVQVKVRDIARNLATSLVCFATKDNILLYTFRFPVENHFTWNKNPDTEQLEILFEKYVRTGVILLQSNGVTLITATLGELEDEVHYEIDFDTESWKQYKGLAYGSIISSGATHMEKFERRMRENRQRWYRSIVSTIRNYKKEKGWNSIYLIGPSELTGTLKELLNENVTAEINRNYANRTTREVLEGTIYAPVEA